LPKTISGKIRRVELRGRENDLNSATNAVIDSEWRDKDFPELRG
jgi:acetyl-CoA synthetase